MKFLKLIKTVSSLQCKIMEFYLLFLGMFFLMGIYDGSILNITKYISDEFLRGVMFLSISLHLYFYIGLTYAKKKTLSQCVCFVLSSIVYCAVNSCCTFEYTVVTVIVFVSVSVFVVATIALFFAKLYKDKQSLKQEKDVMEKEDTVTKYKIHACSVLEYVSKRFGIQAVKEQENMENGNKNNVIIVGNESEDKK